MVIDGISLNRQVDFINQNTLHKDALNKLIANLIKKDGRRTAASVNNPSFNDWFTSYCYIGDISLITFLLTSSELSLHPNINHNNAAGLAIACQAGNLELVQFLLTSPLLIKHVNPYLTQGEIFVKAYNNKHFHIIEWLIYDYNLVLDDILTNITEAAPEIKQIVEKKKTFDHLTITLPEHNKNNNSIKSKI